MKIYILTVSKTRCFGNGTKLIFEEQYIGAYSDLETAKGMIDKTVTDDFRCVCASRGAHYPGGQKVVYDCRYEDRYDCGDEDLYKVIEKEFDIPELEENRSLKKQVKLLEEKVDDLKTRLNALTGSKATYTEEVIKPKKEEKSNVRFDW